MPFFDPDEMAKLDRQAADLNRLASLTDTATPEQSASISALVQHYPHVSPYVTVPLALNGVTPDSPVAKAAAKTEVKRKASRGFGLHSIGDLVTGAASKAKALGSAITPDFVGEAVDAGAVKGFVRGMNMGLEAIPQAVQGEFRNVVQDGRISGGEALNLLNPFSTLAGGFSQTDVASGVREIIAHKGLSGLDYGSGYFVGGRVKQDAIERRRAAAPLIDGHAQSIGRYFGAKVFDPGTKPYNILSGLVDGAILLGGDPTTYVGGPAAKAIKADKLLAGDASRSFVRSGQQISVETKTGAIVGGGPENAAARAARERMLEDAGGVQGALRTTVLPDRVSEWLLSGAGQKVVDHLRDSTSFTDLRRMFKDSIDTKTLVDLTDARTTQDVYNILGPKLGVEIGVKPNAGRGISVLPIDKTPKALVRQTLDGVRLAAALPAKHVDLHDADDAVEQVERMLINFKAPADVRHAVVERMARQTNANGRLQVLEDALSGRKGALLDLGVSPDDANRLTRIFRDYTTDGAKYAVDEVGGNMAVPGVVLDGAGMPLPTPHLNAEYIGRAVPLPDARDVRNATSRLGRMIDATPGLRPTVSVFDWTTQQLFKPLVLLRGAWTVRVVGEEQIRLAASGRSSLLNHPLSHIALATGRKMTTGLTGDVIADTDEAVKALSKGSGHLFDAGKRDVISTGRKRLYERGLPGFNRAWADELAELHLDPVGRRVANGGLFDGDRTPNPAMGMEGIKDWFFHGVGRKFRLEMADAPDRAFLRTREGADAYVDSVLDRVVAKTGADLDLHRVIATGQFNGHNVFDAPLTAGRKSRRAADSFVADLDRRARAGQGPVKVKGDDFLSVDKAPGSAAFAAKDRVVETLFNVLMSRPTNFLSRSPAFKQFYWERSEHLVSFMTKDAQREAITAAEKAGVSEKAVARMRKAQARGSGNLLLEDADVLAKGYGLDSTRKLLYDLHERSQFFDINRNLMPFGEAWKEVLGVWAKIGVENPALSRRASLTVEGARNADVDGDGRGIFYPDPLTGEEMVAFPFSEEFSQLVTGVPVKMQGSAKGLNIFSQSVLPGFGPVVQIAAGRLLPDDPSFDGVRHQLIPFGATDTSGGIVESFMPAWMKKWQTGLGHRSQKQERAYNNTVTDVMRYLLSTGDYSVATPEEQDRLLQDAKRKASVVYLLRGMTQFVAPTAPSTEFVAKDKDGRAQLTFALAEEYRKLQQEDYKTATERFIDKFGENAFLTTIPKTSGGGATTKAALDFARRNPDIEREYRDVFAYFTDAGGDFDLTAYQRQLDSGQREIRTPQEAIDLANQRIATMIYHRAQEKVGDSPDATGRAWLREVKDMLVERYPGYSNVPADMAKTPKLIDQLLRAGGNDKLAATDAGQGLRLYTKARARAQESARAMGLESFDRSPKAVGIRNWLRDVGEAINERHPDFAPMFDQVLERELGDDERGVASG